MEATNFRRIKLDGHEEHVVHDLFGVITLTGLFWLISFHSDLSYLLLSVYFGCEG
jgi:hypothetical protein